MKKITVTLMYLTLQFFVISCEEPKKEKGIEMDNMPIRIVEKGNLFDEIRPPSFLIVGALGSSGIDVNKFSLISCEAVDANQKKVICKIEKDFNPNGSKFGPSIYFEFDFQKSKGPVKVNSIIEYKGVKYFLKAEFIEGKQGDIFLWKTQILTLELFRPQNSIRGSVKPKSDEEIENE